MGGGRKVIKISEVTGMEGDVISMHDIFGFKQTGVDAKGSAQGHFYVSGIRPRCLERLETYGIRLPADLFERRIINLVTRREARRTVTPGLLLILTFLAAVLAVLGLDSVADGPVPQGPVARSAGGWTRSSGSGSGTGSATPRCSAGPGPAGGRGRRRGGPADPPPAVAHT